MDAGALFLGSVYATMRFRTDEFSRDTKLAGNSLNSLDSMFKNATRSSVGFAERTNAAFGQAADGITAFLKPALAVTTAGSFGFGAMANASLDMAKSVQQSTIALAAYTKSADTAQAITNDLIKYAQSDKGVLFKRDELLFAAQSLAGYGAEVGKITDYVKVMSRAVAGGNTTFQELAPILARIGANGQLTATDFEVLTNRGIILDKKMRGAKVTFDELFQSIANAIPESILDKQSKTIEGSIIRLQSAFRNLGNELLGLRYEDPINQLGVSFKPGGLGDQMMLTVERLRLALISPDVKAAIAAFGREIGTLAATVVPRAIDSLVFLAKNINTIIPAISALGVALTTAKIGQGITGIITAVSGASVLNVFIYALVALAGTLYFVETQFGGVTKGLEAIEDSFKSVADFVDRNAVAFAALGVAVAALATPLVVAAARAVSLDIAIRALLAWDAVGKAVGSLGLAFRGLGAAITAVPGVGWIVAGISLLVAAFAFLWQNSESFRGFWFGLWQGIQDATQTVVTWFQTNVVPVFQSVWSAITAGFNGLIEFYRPGWDLFVALAQTAIKTLQEAFSEFGTAFQPIKDVAVGAWNEIEKAWNGLVEVLKPAFETFKNAAVAAWDEVKKAWDELVNAIKPVLDELKNAFTTAWNEIQKAFGVLAPLWVEFKKSIGDFWDKYGSVLTEGLKFLGSVVLVALVAPLAVVAGAVLALAFAVAYTIKFIAWFITTVIDFGKAVGDGVGSAIKWFSELPGRILGALGNLGGLLYNAGRDLIQGLLNGAGSLLANIGKFFVDKLPGFIKEPFKAALGIHSPSRVFFGYGDDTAQGYLDGIASQRSAIMNSMSSLSADAASAFDPVVPVSSLTASQAPSFSGNDSVLGSGVSPSVVIKQMDVNNNVDGLQVARQIGHEIAYRR